MSPRQVTISTLPPDLDHVAGLRVARWLRESTPGQMEQFGPAAQTRLIDEAVARYGLRDTGIGWTVAASGWKQAWLTREWAEMLDAARSGAIDIIATAYVSRFLRNLKQTLIAVEDQLHVAGVAVFFIDERILNPDPPKSRPTGQLEGRKRPSRRLTQRSERSGVRDSRSETDGSRRPRASDVVVGRLPHAAPGTARGRRQVRRGLG